LFEERADYQGWADGVLRSNGRPGRAQLKQLIKAVNQFMKPPDPPKRQIGFLAQVEKGEEGPGGQNARPDRSTRLGCRQPRGTDARKMSIYMSFTKAT
jgi:hypothetical protein